MTLQPWEGFSILCVAAIAVGIVVGTAGPPFVSVAAVVVGILVAVHGYFHRGFTGLALGLLLLLFACGGFRWQMENTIFSDDIRNWNGEFVQILGRVDERVSQVIQPDGAVVGKYTVRLERMLQPREQPLSGRVEVFIRHTEGTEGGAYGRAVRLQGTVEEIRGFGNPGQPDRTMSALARDVHGRMRVQAKDAAWGEEQSGGSADRIIAWQQELRHRVQAVLAPQTAAMATAIMFGGYEGIGREIIRDFSVTGLVHILSVSGSHISLLAALVIGLGRMLRCPVGLTSGFAIGAVLLYGSLAGWSAPVVRSAIMGILAICAWNLDRPGAAVQGLVLAVAGMLLYQPVWLFDIGFQLSALSTAGMVLLTRPVHDSLTRLPAWLALPLAATWSAQLMILPLAAWYFSQISLIAFAANILILPMMEGVLLCGLAGLTAGTLFPYWGEGLLVTAGMLIEEAIRWAVLLAATPYAQISVPAFSWGGIGVYYLLLLWLHGIIQVPIAGGNSRWHGKHAGVTVVSLLCALLLWWPAPQAFSVHFVDVGNGDAALIVTPAGRAVLVDVGGEWGEGESRVDAGERVILPYLRHMGITALDYVILTHGHTDHAGGLATLLQGIPVRNLIISREEEGTRAGEYHLARRLGCGIIGADVGQYIQLDGMILEVVAAGIQENGGRRSGNENSLAVRVNYREHSFFLAGDMEGKFERELALNGSLRPTSVLKVSHHGARNSTDREFLQSLSPRFAVISVGAHNRYGHPHAETLQRLQEQGAEVLRTDQHGCIQFNISPQGNLSYHTYR